MLCDPPVAEWWSAAKPRPRLCHSTTTTTLTAIAVAISLTAAAAAVVAADPSLFILVMLKIQTNFDSHPSLITLLSGE